MNAVQYLSLATITFPTYVYSRKRDIELFSCRLSYDAYAYIRTRLETVSDSWLEFFIWDVIYEGVNRQDTSVCYLNFTELINFQLHAPESICALLSLFVRQPDNDWFETSYFSDALVEFKKRVDSGYDPTV